VHRGIVLLEHDCLQMARRAQLNACAPDPTGQVRTLLEHLTFNVVIGDAGAHGKDISLLRPDEQHVTLAPPYDTVPPAL
jgi:serine/threonine-protein kinase HipA